MQEIDLSADPGRRDPCCPTLPALRGYARGCTPAATVSTIPAPSHCGHGASSAPDDARREFNFATAAGASGMWTVYIGLAVSALGGERRTMKRGLSGVLIRDAIVSASRPALERALKRLS